MYLLVSIHWDDLPANSFPQLFLASREL
jgi:hypothetical protein